jgi:hypothetical protein
LRILRILLIYIAHERISTGLLVLETAGDVDVSDLTKLCEGRAERIVAAGNKLNKCKNGFRYVRVKIAGRAGK